MGGAGAMKVRNPRTGEADHEIAPLGENSVAALARRLRSAQPVWAARQPSDRAAILRRLAAAIEARHAAIADALTTDTGRRAISHVEVRGALGLIARWAASAPDLIAAVEDAPPQPTSIAGITTRTRLVPYPLVGVISPWNFPLTLALIDTIPALAAGAAVIVKPSEVTPRFIRPLMAAVADVPEIADVLAVVEGDGATGAALIAYVDYVAFTGSVATGRKVAHAAAEAMIPASLELGGKDPMIVMASSDPDWAAEVALRASVVNAGQACQSIERIYVDARIAEAFIEALVTKAEAVRLNDADIGSGDIGPFIFWRQADIVEAQLKDAVEKGAMILTGGHVDRSRGGAWLRPTVIGAVSHDMALMREETFGPVLPVVVFDTIDEAVALANDGDFGLSAAVLAGSVEEAEGVAIRLNAGAVSINDGALTSMVWEAEKSSFGASGLGPSRMGASGLMRFFRWQALIRQEGQALPLGAYAEETVR
jgi:acyl-CoA reductase-like NAD-dependent aldehyde dehydrogenase